MNVNDWIVVLGCGPACLLFIGILAAQLKMVSAVGLLSRKAPIQTSMLPTVSAIVPACDEEETIGPTLRALLESTGVDLQVIAVDDRSSDGTGEMIDDMARREMNVLAIHIESIPEGWLGKLNALQRGVQQASGDWLLFADADVILCRDALARAVAHASRHELDLVTVFPQIESAGPAGDVIWNAIGIFTALGLPWRVRDPRSSVALGFGAFILVRREAFETTPGFEWIRLEVADDQGLGMLLKHHGHRCEVLCGRGQVRLVWYRSLREMVLRTQKNLFGIVCGFSLARSLVTSMALLFFSLYPLGLLLPVSHPWLLAIPLSALVAHLLSAATFAAWCGRGLLPSVFAPIGQAFVAFMVLRAGTIGARRGGIEWRGVLYPSARLRDEQRFGIPGRRRD